jgi:hypothetical protein
MASFFLQFKSAAYLPQQGVKLWSSSRSSYKKRIPRKSKFQFKVDAAIVLPLSFLKT